MTQRTYPRCRTCRWWERNDNQPRDADGLTEIERQIWERHGIPTSKDYGCNHPKMRVSYREPAPEGGIVAEEDEGWGFVTDPSFGCVNHEPLEGGTDAP